MSRFCLCFLLLSSTLTAGEIVLDKQQPPLAESTSDKPPKVETDLIDGLILNRAMTRFGHRFYREFVAAYRDIGGVAQHSGLTVVEQATARSGSKISILHNRRPIYITVVSPAS
ncbi:CsgE family curli-type amyloid fiber assembly protein, partial [Shewanella sp. 0m-11]